MPPSLTPREELIAPVVGSTLTTVVVFAPLGLLSGVVGQFFRALSLTLSVAVLVSLVLSLTLIPLLARAFVRRRPRASQRRALLERVYVAHAAALAAASGAVAALALVVLAAGARAGYTLVGIGLPAGGRRGRLRHRLPDAVGHGARRRPTRGCARSRRSSRTRRDRDVFAPHRIGAGSVRDAAEHRRHPRAPQAARRSRSIPPTRSSRTLRDKLAGAVPDTEIEFVQLLQDMLGDLEGNPDPIEVKIFGDDPDVARRARRRARAEAREDRRRRRRRRAVARQSRGDLAGRSGRRRPARADGRAGREPAVGGVGRRSRDRPAPADRSIPVRVRYPGRLSVRSPSSSRATPVRGADGHARAGVVAGDDHARERPGGTAAREPAADGAGHRAPRASRPRQRASPKSRRCSRARSCRSATPSRSAASTRRSGRRFASC